VYGKNRYVTAGGTYIRVWNEGREPYHFYFNYSCIVRKMIMRQKKMKISITVIKTKNNKSFLMQLRSRR
jgi:hypothetical protein